MTLAALDPTVQAELIAAAGAVLLAVLGMVAAELRRQGRTLRRTAADAAEARDQVANTHQTNLRDDLDGLTQRLDLVLSKQDSTDEQIGALRGELAHERAERLALSNRLDRLP